MMKIRRIIAILCTAAMLISVTACGSNESSKPSDEKSSVSSEPTISEEASSEDSSVTEESKESDESSETEETSASSVDKPSSDTTDIVDKLDDIVSKDVEETIAELTTEYEQLKSDVDSYAKYLKNAKNMRAFYINALKINRSLCVKMYGYALAYAEAVVSSGDSSKDIYNDLEKIYEIIYDDNGQDMYDKIYDGILADMYDVFYDGILADAYDNEEYSDYTEWSDARSDEYKWWSDARSDIYEDWSDMRSDIYKFWSIVRSEVYSDDIEDAKKEIEDFRNHYEKIKKEVAP